MHCTVNIKLLNISTVIYRKIYLRKVVCLGFIFESVRIVLCSFVMNSLFMTLNQSLLYV